jgi:hypothetical protein
MRLKDEDVGRIFYDGDGAWTVKRKVRNKKKLVWVRRPEFERKTEK